MKVIVLGGAGDMGRRAVEDLAVSKEVTKVTIADRNIKVAREIAKALEGKGTELAAIEIDANDHGALVEAMEPEFLEDSHSLRILHRYGAPLSRRDVLCRVEAETGIVAVMPGAFSIPLRFDRVGGIFDYDELVLVSNLPDTLHIAHLTV